MSHPVQSVVAQRETPTFRAAPVASVEERWAAWEAKGAAHDRGVRRKMAIAGPILLMLAAVILYGLVGR